MFSCRTWASSVAMSPSAGSHVALLGSSTHSLGDTSALVRSSQRLHTCTPHTWHMLFGMFETVSLFPSAFSAEIRSLQIQQKGGDTSDKLPTPGTFTQGIAPRWQRRSGRTAS